MAASRSEVRAEFRALVANELLGEGKLLQALYGYMVADFKQQSPVMVIASSGTDRRPLTFEGSRPDYLLNVYIFVLYAALDGQDTLVLGSDGQPVWSEADSEAAADEIERQFGDFLHLKTTQRGRSWQSISYASPTQTELAFVGGKPYRQETIQLRFGCY
jgi:hypothetical protein